jgi:FtsH-binding integral membrane protein
MQRTILERLFAMQPVPSSTMGLYGAGVGTVIGIGLMNQDNKDSDIYYVPTSAFVCATIARAYPVTTMYTPHVVAFGTILSGITYGTMHMVIHFSKKDTV